MTVVLAGAKMAKLMKIIASQKVSTAMNGKGIELPLCSSSNHRAPDLEADAQRLRLERALSLIPWRERLDLVIDARDRTPARAAPLEHGSWATPAQDERRHRRDEPHPQLHDVLRLRTQMMLGQDGAEQQAEQCACS